MERTFLVHPAIVFGGDTDVVELIEKLTSYPKNSARDVCIEGVLSSKSDWRPQEATIHGNLQTKEIRGNRITLNVSGNIQCDNSIDVGILKVGGNVCCDNSLMAYDFTAKGEVCCGGPLNGQFVAIGKYLSITKEIYPAINVNFLSVGGDIYCKGSMKGDSLFVAGDVYCKKYMDIHCTKIKGQTFIEEE